MVSSILPKNEEKKSCLNSRLGRKLEFVGWYLEELKAPKWPYEINWPLMTELYYSEYTVIVSGALKFVYWQVEVWWYLHMKIPLLASNLLFIVYYSTVTLICWRCHHFGFILFQFSGLTGITRQYEPVANFKHEIDRVDYVRYLFTGFMFEIEERSLSCGNRTMFRSDFSSKLTDSLLTSLIFEESGLNVTFWQKTKQIHTS